MNYQELLAQIKAKKSVLCVGLDTDPEKIPAHLRDEADPVFEFNRAIIDAVAPYSVALKPNIAFYEALGLNGWRSLEKTLAYARSKHPELFLIADAKRGDIGNTASRYAKAFFEALACDAVTVAPYMGSDSVTPFLQFSGKWAVLLGLTSNKGADDFQMLKMENGRQLYQQVLETSQTWGTQNNLMYVVGATRPDFFREVRKIVPHHFLLVPGVGAQGGSVEEVMKNAILEQPALLINSSRGVIYASSGSDFAQAAAFEAEKLQKQMKGYL